MARLDDSAFLQPKLSVKTLDHFWVKKSILEAITKSLQDFSGTLLDIGCGQQPYKSLVMSPPSKATSYIGLDLEGEDYAGAGAVQPDLKWDGNVIPLPENSVGTAFATEVLEHCPDPGRIFEEIHRVLQPGGRLFFTVPFLWPIHDAPNDYYRYTPFALEKLLQKAGFSQHRIEALGGWDASLAQMICLWAMRRPISSRRAAGIRRLLGYLSLPIVKALYGRDRKPESLATNTMITGLSCIAQKRS